MKNVLITGASSGFGSEVARILLSQPDVYRVYVAARRVDQMQSLVDIGARALYVDVANQESVDKAIEEMLNEVGHIDILFNNAGFGCYGTVEDVDMQKAHYQFEVNVFGAARMARAVLPSMRGQRQGLIINTSSMAGDISCAGLGWYSATKHALEALSVALRQEVKDLGINVVMIKPGPVKTGFEQVMLEQLHDSYISDDYRQIIQGFENWNVEAYKQAPGPRSTVEAVIKAIESKNPRFKYRTTFMAYWSVWLERIVGQRISDRLMLMIFKKYSK